MLPSTHKRRAISVVLTTLIILVASVVLATGIIFYGTSMFQTQAQSQTLVTTGTQLWVDYTTNSGWAWGATDVRNGGDKMLAVDTITIRGSHIPYSNWYYDTNTARVTIGNFQTALNYTGLFSTVTGQLNNYTGAASNNCPASSPGPLVINLDGKSATTPVLCLTQATGPVVLAPGVKAIIYFKIPQNTMTGLDVGNTANVGLYAGQVGSPVSVTAIAK